MDKRFKLGIYLTIIWLSLMTAIVFGKYGGWGEIAINDWGDFFGGFLAPVAFLWLVLGYMQQCEDLKQNTLVLQQQKNEFSKSAKLSALSALMQHEINETQLLNSLGPQFKDGAKNARNRAKERAKEINELLDEIGS